MKYTYTELAKMIDHSLLHPTTSTKTAQRRRRPVVRASKSSRPLSALAVT